MARQRVTTEDLIVGAESLLDRVRTQLKKAADKVKIKVKIQSDASRGPAVVQSGESSLPNVPDSEPSAAPKTVRVPPGQARAMAAAMSNAKTVTGQEAACQAKAETAVRKFETEAAVGKATAAADAEPTEDAIARKGALEQLVDLEDTSEGDLDGIDDLLGEVDALIDSD